MKIFTLNSLKTNLLFLGILCCGSVVAQEDDTKKTKKSEEIELNMDAVFNRPALSFDKVPVTVGGYLEANTMHRTEEGITDGLSFQARRLTIFMAASISERIKFLTEIEFEDGGKEVAIEFAALDVAFHPLFNFRGGIVMNPIGAFNENHDGPKWEFVERPDVAVNMLAATLSNAGFGISYMGGTYNKFEDDGEEVEDQAKLDVFAIDWNTTIKATGTYIVGEAAWIWAETPDTYTQQYGNKQRGVFMDIVQPVYKSKIFEWEDATFNVAARFDYVDWNVGQFAETNTKIGDQILAVTPGISFRPTPKTVFRINYRYEWKTDILNNPAVQAATWYMGFSSYF